MIEIIISDTGSMEKQQQNNKIKVFPRKSWKKNYLF